jgi:hypothetical protein
VGCVHELSPGLGLRVSFHADNDQLCDRVALSVAATPIRTEFGVSQVQMGYLLSSFLWMCCA